MGALRQDFPFLVREKKLLGDYRHTGAVRRWGHCVSGSFRVRLSGDFSRSKKKGLEDAVIILPV